MGADPYGSGPNFRHLPEDLTGWRRHDWGPRYLDPDGNTLSDRYLTKANPDGSVEVICAECGPINPPVRPDQNLGKCLGAHNGWHGRWQRDRQAATFRVGQRVCKPGYPGEGEVIGVSSVTVAVRWDDSDRSDPDDFISYRPRDLRPVSV